jgi:hypothetical protein
MLNGLERRFEGELVQTRRIVRIEVANHSEVSAAKFSTAVPQREDEAGCVGDVVGLRAELQVHTLGHREILEEGCCFEACGYADASCMVLLLQTAN